MKLRTTPLSRLLGLFLLVLLVSNCGRRDAHRIVVDPGFGSYINAFTSGVVSSQSTIKVVLIEASEKAQPGQIIDDDIFDFSPSIDGQAYWLDEQTIEFRPNKRLPSGESFVVEFDLGSVLDVPSAFETLEFGFMVIKQSLFVQFEGLKTLSKTDYSKQEIYGTIRTSDVAEAAELEQCLKAAQDGDKLELSWEHNTDGKSHRFTVKGVVRGKSESSVDLEWDGDPIGADISDDLEIRIPPIGEFSLVQATTQRSPGLHFSLQFSDPLDDRQNLTGLVYLNSGKQLRLSIEGNEIKAYPIGNVSSEETIVVEAMIRNSQNKELGQIYQRVVQFNLEKPLVELIGDGVIMPSSGAITFPFKAINLRAVNMRIVRIYENNIQQFFQDNHYSGYSSLRQVGRIVYDEEVDLYSSDPIDYGVWNNFSVDLGDIIKPEPGAIYRIMISFERSQSLYPCSDEYGEAKPLKKTKTNWDDGRYYDWDDWYDEPYSWDEKDDPCTSSYYTYYNRPVSTNLFASNIGMVAKEATEHQYDVIVTDLRTAEPMSGIDIEAYNYQQQKIGEGSTNGDGLARFKTDGKPYLLMAKNGVERGYLRVDNGSALSVSLYDVGGITAVNGLKAFLYGERGVWRPGDSIFLSVMVEDQQKSLPPNHPVVVELTDPMGKLYERKVTTKGVEGLYAFKLQTHPDDPTGTWNAKAIIGNSEFSKSLKVETVKPNRIRIDLDAGGDVVTSSTSLNLDLQADWLYGAPAANMKARTELSFSNMKTEFKGYDGYQFDDRSKSFYFDETIISERTTSSDGSASLNFSYSLPSSPPGMLKMRLSTKVFEQGGDFSQDFMSLKYSPYTSYVGFKLPGGGNWSNAINTEETHAISIVAIDPQGNPMSRNVRIELYEMGWNWWYESDDNEISRYINRNSSNIVKTDYVEVKNGKVLYDLDFPHPDWGRYAIRIVDEYSDHSAMETFYVRSNGWRRDDEGSNESASMLMMESDKEAYDVDDEIEITVPSGGEGRIYVSVEKGDRILDQFWVDAANGSTTFSVDASKEMAPNIYINAMLIQPHGQTDNDLPIRMYGLLPISVSDAETRLTPMISCPDEIAPETEFTVEVSEKDGKDMAYTLAIVDEGLLSLTRFRTPDPWPSFYAKEALAVRTWDLYEYIMDAQTGKMTSLLAMGGDGNLVYKEDEKANRFKPVVRFIGPFHLDGGKNKHTLKLPNYIGAVRVMVVAGEDGAYGKAEKEMKVNQPLMVLSTLPRVLGPGEKVRIPVNVITMKDNIKNVSVKIETNDLLNPTTTSQNVTFAKAGEQTVFFDCSVARALGKATFKVTVSSGAESAFEELELMVRPPNPPITNVESKMVPPGTSWSYNYTARGIKGTNKGVLQVSKIPDLDLEKHLQYLIRYPHGCIEQTTSSVLPQLFVSNLIDISSDMEDEIERNVQAGLERLRQFQISSGAFAYWPGNDHPSLWGTNYAGHFILEAKERGYKIPAGMIDQWLKFQQNEASMWRRNTYDEYGRYGDDLTQAYRLYTMALSGNEDLGAMNRLRSDGQLSDRAAWRLAAAYAMVGREDVAMELAQRSYSFEYYREMGYTYGSNVRDLAMVLETMTYLQDHERMMELTKDIAADLRDGWHSTQTRAYAMLAISKMVGGGKASNEFKFEAVINGKEQSIDSDVPVVQLPVDEGHLMTGSVSVSNSSASVLFVSFVQSGIPVEFNDPKLEDEIGMRVSYVDMKGNPLSIANLKQGTDFKAQVRISHPGVRANYEEVALSQIFPSGWQIVNTRVASDAPSEDKTFEYRDIRDDRVYTYFDLKRGESKSFEVLLNATFTGEFYMPSLYCAPMYDESIKAQIPGQWVKVQ